MLLHHVLSPVLALSGLKPTHCALIYSFFVFDLEQEKSRQVWGGPDGCGCLGGYRSAGGESQAQQVYFTHFEVQGK